MLFSLAMMRFQTLNKETDVPIVCQLYAHHNRCKCGYFQQARQDMIFDEKSCYLKEAEEGQSEVEDRIRNSRIRSNLHFAVSDHNAYYFYGV